MNIFDYCEELLDRETIVVMVLMAAMGAVGLLFLACTFMDVTVAQLGAGLCMGLIVGLFGLILSLTMFMYVLRPSVDNRNL